MAEDLLDRPAARARRGAHLVEERFHRWSEESVTALLVRVYSLPAPVALDALESYAGCKSWITLAEQVPLDGARPVLADADFERKLAEVKALVAGSC